MPDITKEKAREMMELAIAEMRDSVQEKRQDSAPSPKVGAVILFPDGTTAAAHRGELREGDHAEYTLIERKLPHKNLDGAILFSTLEPCGPTARKAPKRGCAKRIVSARIRTVYMGVQDPHPKVAGHGLAYLQANGVDVRLFERDLQDRIEAEDPEFFAHARRAAQEVEIPDAEYVPLDALDVPLPNTTLDFLSKDALSFYREKTEIESEVGSAEFDSHLEQAGFLTNEHGEAKPTGQGLLLFGKSPQDTYTQAPLYARIEFPDGTTEARVFDGPLVLIPDAVEDWLKPKLPNIIDRSSMQRKEGSSIPFEVLREAIVNALVHRDYDIEGANIQVVVTPDAVKVSSPGGPTPPLTLEQLQRFTAPMISRNPKLHYAFVQVDLAEKMGFGLPSLRNRAQELGVPLPKFEYDAPYLALTIYRHPGAAVSTLHPDTLNSLSVTEREGWQWMSKQGPIRSVDYAQHMGMDTRSARRHLQRFLELDLIEQEGATRGTRYRPKGT